ncbi:MAG: ABC transporter permease, partial [Bacteroidota bacterium]
MRRYVLRRLLLLPPSLILISLIGFMIQAWHPEDPLEQTMPDITSTAEAQAYAYRNLARDLHLDTPAFYVELTTYSSPDTLHRILFRAHREAASHWLHQTGNWTLIHTYRQSLLALQRAYQVAFKQQDDSMSFASRKAYKSSFTSLGSLLSEKKLALHTFRLESIQAQRTKLAENTSIETALAKALQDYDRLRKETTRWKNYLPQIIWHGLGNRYHIWIVGIMTEFDFGLSKQTQLPVTQNKAAQMAVSFRFTIWAFVLGFGLSILLAVWIVSKAYEWQDKAVSTALFMLDAIPSFWLATLLLIFLSGPILPPIYDSSIGGLHEASTMVLPILAYVLGMLTALTRLLRASLLDLQMRDFIRTARAKGLSKRQTLWRHSLRPALSPIITAFGLAFPGLFTGSVIIETIFSIPGIGKAIINASNGSDIYAIVLFFCLIGLLTILGQLIGDILRAWADPRAFKKEGS